MKNVAADLLTTIENATPLLLAISDVEAAIKPNPEKWSCKEVIGHLIDSACNNQQKFVRTIQKDGEKFPPYEQEKWVAIQKYNDAEWNELIGLWSQYNKHIAHIIKHIPDEALPNELYIGGKGPFTLDFIVRDYPEHMKHHLKQIIPDAPFFNNNFKMVY